MPLSGLVVVQRVQGLLRAQAVKAYLESKGVPVALDYESAGPAIGLTLDGLGEVRVLVPARLKRFARRLLIPRRRFGLSRMRRGRAVRTLRRPQDRSRGRPLPTTVGRPR